MKYIIGLDEGTTSARSVLFDVKAKKIITTSNHKFKQYFPKPGWVEQDPKEILDAQFASLKEVLNGINPKDVIGIGITNQRETVVAWDKTTGEPVYNAIVWQCRRTSKRIERLSSHLKRVVKNRTGLIPDAYFSASKMEWILNNVPKAKALAKDGNLCFGNINTYLAYIMTGEFVTDTTNASRTMLFNINTLEWDPVLLKLFKIPKNTLPEVVSCDHIVGKCKDFFDIPLCAMIGDQQSSLFGQSCVTEGSSKTTYGTGSFTLVNTGDKIVNENKLLSTIAYTIGGKTKYAIEGSVYSACSAIEWLKSDLKLFDSYDEIDDLACKLQSNDGVYFVPAFTGLGAPYWNSNAKTAIIGLTYGCDKSHIARSILESMAYNTRDILERLKGIKIHELKVDGGGTKNKFLTQYLADITGKNVLLGLSSEATAMGAIYMAGIATKTFTITDIKNMYKIKEEFSPKMNEKLANEYYKKWKKTVNLSLKGN